MDVSSKSSSSRSITVHWLWVSELTPLPGIYFGAEKIVDLLERNAFQGWCFQPYEVMAIWSLTFLGFLCSPSLISPQGVFERRDWKCIPELLPLLFLSEGSPFAERINHHCAQTWTKPAGEEAHLLVDRGMLILSIRKYWEAHLLAVHSLILALSTIKVMLEFSTCPNLSWFRIWAKKKKWCWLLVPHKLQQIFSQWEVPSDRKYVFTLFSIPLPGLSIEQHCLHPPLD